MRATLISRLETLRSSYWFLPAVMAVLAALLSFVMVWLDNVLGTKWMGNFGWIYANKPEGARTLLSTVAGSMIGVAGVTFSITIAAVAYASGQFGPRMLTNFMRDRTNQATLGVFIATFLYCLLSLRTIRSGDETTFVPNLTVLVGMGFGIASIGFLINFIHHIAGSIHASNVIAAIGGDLAGMVDTLYPERIGAPKDVDGDGPHPPIEQVVPEGFEEEAVAIASDSQGYVRAISDIDLMHAACAHDVIVRLVSRPGDFLAKGRPIAFAWPAERVDDSVASALNAAVVTGAQRTPHQDIRLLVEQLVDMAGRALSPGVNDPLTAIACLQWLGAALSEMANRDRPFPYRAGNDGELRIITRPITFADLAEIALGHLRPYFAADPNAARGMVRTMVEVMLDAPDVADRKVIAGHAEALLEHARSTLILPADIAALEDGVRFVKQLVDDPPGRKTLADSKSWLHGPA